MKPAPENRRGGRIGLALTAVVRAKENHETYWKETTDLVSISRSGAGFYLKRHCDVGRLVSLIMPMPRHLRAHDRERELYRVWGLVQHCSPVYGAGTSSFHVGVAFIGRHVPPSYHENPAQSYRICGMQEDGTWKVVEAKSDFVVRRHPRYWISIQTALSVLDDDKNMLTDEKAVTENISASGAAVFTSLDVNVGDSVTLDCDLHDFASMAVVRNRRDADNGKAKLHLEFIGKSFPIGDVKIPDGYDVRDEDASDD